MKNFLTKYRVMHPKVAVFTGIIVLASSFYISGLSGFWMFLLMLFYILLALDLIERGYKQIHTKGMISMNMLPLNLRNDILKYFAGKTRDKLAADTLKNGFEINNK